MADSADQVQAEFTETVVYLGAERVPFRFLGRMCAEVRQQWDSGVLRHYVLYETSDGQVVRSALVLEDHANQRGVGVIDMGDIFDTPECACAALEDEELRAELLRQVAERKSKFAEGAPDSKW